MLDTFLGKIKRNIIPEKIFNFFQPIYHWTLSLLAAIWYRFPSRQIRVIAVTGTKGKSSTVEIINAIFEGAGYKTALSNTIRFKIDERSQPNLYKMSMPGRFSVQKLIRQAVNAGCHYIVIEMTSQGALLYRHRFIELDVLVFTNISPEHIEAHGSYENYLASKLRVAQNMAHSKKIERSIIVNADDPESDKFMACPAEKKISYSIHDADPYIIKKEGLDFTMGGRTIHSHLSGLFNLYNILAAAAAAHSQGISDNEISRAIENFTDIPGRVQKIIVDSADRKQDFSVVVDYAHTPDSLEKFYQVFQTSRNICILGGTGGGRDTWKRGEMGRIAEKYCDEIILTNEDPYDEDPKKIIDDVRKGITVTIPSIIMDRREAIREAIKRAQTGDAILITGKGTDPYIMGANNTKIPWSDAQVAEEELTTRSILV
ncbi:MAG: UDP-N-acetylmuramoyl-L-alanyl-D-glutamate--2,6-diaminopimelate ligase [Candidatus Taylorbacteria bacterium]